jgi:hypothetical protein
LTLFVGDCSSQAMFLFLFLFLTSLPFPRHQSDVLRIRHWDLRHSHSLHHLQSAAVTRLAIESDSSSSLPFSSSSSSSSSSSAAVDTSDLIYSSSPYHEEDECPEVDDNKMLKYWEKHIIPRVQDYVRQARLCVVRDVSQSYPRNIANISNTQSGIVFTVFS